MPAAAAADASISMALDRDAIRHGETVVASGVVSPPRDGQPVTLWYGANGGQWAVGHATTDASGNYSVAYAPPVNGYLWMVAPDAVPGQSPASAAELAKVAGGLAGDGRDDLVRNRVHAVSGTLLPARGGRSVTLQKLEPRGWRTIAVSRTRDDGTYALRWTPVALGVFPLRVAFAGDRLNRASKHAVPGGISVYRLTRASWYGPGFFGNLTACGARLARTTLGVAHKRLRCGTRVKFNYRGRTLTVPVVDRGPFIPGREWDLTAAAKERLGFPGLGRIGSTR